MTAQQHKPDNRVLSGIRIVDFSRLLPGPWATQLLADLGADVIKVEQPVVGDYARHNPPNYKDSGVYYNSVNSNKRSIVIDLANEEGRAVAHRLIEKSDVIVESFRTGVAKKLDVHYERARALNESIVYCAITGYGQDGPLSRVPGHDLVIQSMTGLMGMSMDREPLPPVPGFQAADYAGGAMVPTAIMAALMRKQQTGEGCYIDLSMFDCLFYMCNIVLTSGMSRFAGSTGEPAIQVWGANPRYDTYLCGDNKPVAVSLLEAVQWRQFCNFIERPDLIHADEGPEDRHTTHGDRAPIYREAIASYCKAHTRDSLLAKMEAEQIPVCAISTPDEALASENVTQRGLIEYVDHPTDGRIPHLKNPLDRTGMTLSDRKSAPGLGADNNDILEELGYSEAERADLQEKGAVTS
jgi:crotonobetainyl-CoA:carnitine CoA-transferase CaiB-like acyl-CoA transferase